MICIENLRRGDESVPALVISVNSIVWATSEPVLSKEDDMETGLRPECYVVVAAFVYAIGVDLGFEGGPDGWTSCV